MQLEDSDPTRASSRRSQRAAVAAAVSILILAATVTLAFLPSGPDAPLPGETEGDSINTPGAVAEYTIYESADALLADYRGQPLVVNFFASWCAPCRAELPDFARAHAEYGDRVAFVGVDYQDPDRQAAIELLSQTGVTYPIAEDATGALLEELSGLPAMPTTIFIDSDGTIADRHRGIILADELRTKIEQLLT